jgi:hypothetical protein
MCNLQCFTARSEQPIRALSDKFARQALDFSNGASSGRWGESRSQVRRSGNREIVIDVELLCRLVPVFEFPPAGQLLFHVSSCKYGGYKFDARAGAATVSSKPSRTKLCAKSFPAAKSSSQKCVKKHSAWS